MFFFLFREDSEAEDSNARAAYSSDYPASKDSYDSSKPSYSDAKRKSFYTF